MGEKGKAKPWPIECKVVKILVGNEEQYLVSAPEGFIMKSVTGAWYRSIRLEADRDG